MCSVVPPIPALGASIERSERRTGIRYPASEYRLETSAISHPLFLEESAGIDMMRLSGDIGSISDMFHEQLPLPVPCSCSPSVSTRHGLYLHPSCEGANVL